LSTGQFIVSYFIQIQWSARFNITNVERFFGPCHKRPCVS
jgi:hypothetical protein